MAKIADLKAQARELERRGEFEKALIVCQHILTHLEGKPALATQIPLFVKVGDLLSKLGRVDDAVESYETAAAHYARDGNGQRVAALCLKAFTVDPSRADLFRMWAAQLLEKGHRDACRVVLLEYARQLRLTHAADALERAAGGAPHAVEPLVRQVLSLGVGTDLPVEEGPASADITRAGTERDAPDVEPPSASDSEQLGTPAIDPSLWPSPEPPRAPAPERETPDAEPSLESSLMPPLPPGVEPPPPARAEPPPPSAEPPIAPSPAPAATPPVERRPRRVPFRPLRGPARPTALGDGSRGVPAWAWAAALVVMAGVGAVALLGPDGDAARAPVPSGTAAPDTMAAPDSLAVAGLGTDTVPPLNPLVPDPVGPLDTAARVPLPVQRLPPGVSGPVVVVRDLPLDSVIETGTGPSRTVRVVQTLRSGESLELTITPFGGADTVGISPPQVTGVGDLSAGTVRAGAWMVNARARVPLETLQAALRRLTILRP